VGSTKWINNRKIKFAGQNISKRFYCFCFLITSLLVL